MILIADAVEALGLDTASFPVIGYDNVVTPTSVSTTTAQTNFPASNMGNPSTRPPWKGTVNSPLTTEYITVQSVDLPISYFAVVAHNFGSTGATLTIETCTSIGSSPQVWTAVNFDSSPNYTPDDDSPILWRFTQANYQGVRLKIVPGSAGPECGAVYCGDLLVLERSVRVDTTHKLVNLNRKTQLSSGMSERGDFLGRTVLREWVEGKADFSFFSSAWYRANFDPFLVATQTKPFFFAWSPVDHPEDLSYIWWTSDPSPDVNTMVDRFNISLNYQGVT